MFCQQCGKELPENARFCPACGTQVHSEPAPDIGTALVNSGGKAEETTKGDHQEKKTETASASQRGPVFRAAGVSSGKTGNKKKLIGVFIAVAVIAALVIGITHLNKDIDPEVLSGVEERAILEVYQLSLPELEQRLGELYPDLIWSYHEPNNKNNQLKSPKELGTTNGIYKVYVYLDIYLYSKSSGEQIGVTSAHLTGDVKLTNRTGGYKFVDTVVEVNGDPYMYDGSSYTGASSQSSSYSEGSQNEILVNDDASTLDIAAFCSILESGLWVSSRYNDYIQAGWNEYGLNIQCVTDGGELIFEGDIDEYAVMSYEEDNPVVTFDGFDGYRGMFKISLCYTASDDMLILYMDDVFVSSYDYRPYP